MEMKDLNTPAENTWCPGCGNFPILSTFKSAVVDLVNDGVLEEHNVAYASGIGCHAKIADYINLNSFYSVHGRVAPTITGMKIANPNLTVVGFVGDGDQFGEGISHIIHAAKRNEDITIFLHNNEVFALTTGQFSPTTPLTHTGSSTPFGNPEPPLNPIALMIASNASFVARTFAGNPNHMKSIMKEAIMHKGFSFVEILQPCVSFFNFFKEVSQKTYDLQQENHDFTDKQAAFAKAMETSRIPIGIFYKSKRKVFSDHLPALQQGLVPALDRSAPSIESFLERSI